MIIAAILLATEIAPSGDVAAALTAHADDETLIEWQIAQLRAAGVDIVEVVLGCDAERIIPLVSGDNIEPIVHPTWEHDHAGAVRIGATAVPRETGAAIIVDVAHPADAATCSALLEAHAASGASVTRVGAPAAAGTPLVVDAGVLAELRNATDDRGGLEAVLQRHERT